MTLLSRQSTSGNLFGLISNLPAPGVRGRRYITSDSGFEYVDDGTSWRCLLNGFLCSPLPNQSLFTKINLESDTYTNKGNNLEVVAQSRGGVQTTAAIRLATVSPVSVTTAVLIHPIASTLESAFTTAGICLSNGTALYTLDTGIAHSYSAYSYYYELASYSSFNSRTSLSGASIPCWRPLFLRLYYDGANIISYYGLNPHSWIQIGSVVAPFVPTHVGLNHVSLSKASRINYVHYSEVF